MKIGIAITLYDKFEELEQLIKIIRSWKEDYCIDSIVGEDNWTGDIY